MRWRVAPSLTSDPLGAFCFTLLQLSVLDVTRQTGAIARDKILIAHDILKNDGRSHRMVTEAIRAFVWTQHKKSMLRDQFRSILQDYTHLLPRKMRLISFSRHAVKAIP